MNRTACILIAAGLMLAACSGDGDDEPKAKPAPCPSPVRVDQRDLKLLPKGLPLEKYGVVVKVQLKRGFVNAEAVGRTRIVELYPPLARTVLDHGYQIVSSENEGFEAEIFFARNRKFSGAYRLIKGPCPGDVTIKLIYGETQYPGT